MKLLVNLFEYSFKLPEIIDCEMVTAGKFNNEAKENVEMELLLYKVPIFSVFNFIILLKSLSYNPARITLFIQGSIINNVNSEKLSVNG